MLKISRKGDYALLLLSFLTNVKESKAISLRKISKKLNMPYKYLSQIAPVLVEDGILGSKEGAGGGYSLARDPKKISVSEVLELLEGPMAPVACMREGCFCEPNCVQRNVIEKMTASLKEAMDDYTLADLAGGSGN